MNFEFKQLKRQFSSMCIVSYCSPCISLFHASKQLPPPPPVNPSSLITKLLFWWFHISCTYNNMSLCGDRIYNIQNQVPHQEWRSDSLELLRLTQTRLPEQHFFPAPKIRQRAFLCFLSCTDSLPTPGVRKKWISGASLWTNFDNSNTFVNHFR